MCRRRARPTLGACSPRRPPTTPIHAPPRCCLAHRTATHGPTSRSAGRCRSLSRLPTSQPPGASAGMARAASAAIAACADRRRVARTVVEWLAAFPRRGYAGYGWRRERSRVPCRQPRSPPVPLAGAPRIATAVLSWVALSSSLRRVTVSAIGPGNGESLAANRVLAAEFPTERVGEQVFLQSRGGRLRGAQYRAAVDELVARLSRTRRSRGSSRAAARQRGPALQGRDGRTRTRTPDTRTIIWLYSAVEWAGRPGRRHSARSM